MSYVLWNSLYLEAQIEAMSSQFNLAIKNILKYIIKLNTYRSSYYTESPKKHET